MASYIWIVQENLNQSAISLFIVDGKIVTGSRYRPSISKEIPQEVLDFGDRMIQIWTPHPNFVLDICSTENGLKVVECNRLNGSGFYASDIEKLVWEVSQYQEKSGKY